MLIIEIIVWRHKFISFDERIRYDIIMERSKKHISQRYRPILWLKSYDWFYQESDDCIEKNFQYNWVIAKFMKI